MIRWDITTRDKHLNCYELSSFKCQSTVCADKHRADKAAGVRVNLATAECGELGCYLSPAFMNKQVVAPKFELQ